MSKHSFGVTTSVPVIVIGVPLVLGGDEIRGGL
jgi:hypothetical protein